MTKKALEEKNHDTNRDNKTIKKSKEVILLQNYRWVMLKNRDEINYSYNRHYHKMLGMNVDTYIIEKLFLQLDPNFEGLRDLKEEYIQFNHNRILWATRKNPSIKGVPKSMDQILSKKGKKRGSYKKKNQK